MYEQVKKKKEGKSSFGFSHVIQNKSNKKIGFNFVDNRPLSQLQKNIRKGSQSFTQNVLQLIKNNNFNGKKLTIPVNVIQLTRSYTDVQKRHINNKRQVKRISGDAYALAKERYTKDVPQHIKNTQSTAYVLNYAKDNFKGGVSLL